MKQVANYPAQSGPLLDQLPEVAGAIQQYQESLFVDLQQRSHEFAELAKNPNTMRSVLPLDSTDDDVYVESKLSFLDGFVQTAISNGAREYDPEIGNEDDATDDGPREVKLQFNAYQRQTASNTSTYTSNTAATTQPTRSESYTSNDNNSGLKLTGVNKAWGMPVEPTSQPEPPPTNTAPSTDMFSQPEPEPAAQPVRMTRPTRAPEVSAKQQAANALFAGLGGVTAPSRPKRGGKKAAAKRQPARQTAPTPAPAPAPAATIDIFAEVASVPTPAPAPAQQPAAAAAVDLMDIFGGTTSPAPAPVSNTAPVDLADLMGGASSSPQGGLDFGFGATSAPEVKCGAAGMNPAISQKLGQMAHSQETELVNNQQIYLSSYSVTAPSSTMMVLFLTNKGASPLSNVQIQIQQHQCYAYAFDGDNAQRGQPTPNGNWVIAIQTLAPGSTSTQLVMLQCKHFSALNSLNFTGAITYQESAPSSFSLSLNPTDLLRPLNIDVKVYGRLWQQMPANCQLQEVRRTSVTNNGDFKSRMDALNIRHITASGAENLCAGTLVSGSQQSALVCLVYGKLGPPQVLLRLRTSNKAFSDLLAPALQQALA
jgi:hypothetical protein